MCWTVINAFIRIGTNSRIFKRPLLLDEAINRVNSWFRQPNVRLIHSTDKHWDIYQHILTKGQASGNLVTDAHLASIAIQHGCTLYSTDQDFSRFPSLKWKNPIK